MNHQANCKLCEQGFKRLKPDQYVFGILHKATRIYWHAIASSIDEIKFRYSLTNNQAWITMLPNSAVKDLQQRKEASKMFEEKSLQELQKLAHLGQAVLDLVAKNGATAFMVAAPKKKRHRRTKAELEAAKQATAASPAPVKTGRKRKNMTNGTAATT